MRSVLLFIFFLPLLTIAQKKKITFRSEYVAGFTTEEDEKLFDANSVTDASGKRIETKEYNLSADKKKILFFNGREPIYRRSSKSTVYVYDVASKKAVNLHKSKVLHPTFSPDGTRVAYVFDNNLYVYDIASAKTTAVSTDGKWNNIINGNCDWVYEEEFEFTSAFEWSPNSTYIAYC